MIEVVETGYSTPKQIQDIIINDAANASETETYSIDKIKDLIENSTPEILPLPIFINNTSALAGGLLANNFYRLPILNDISLVAVVTALPVIPNFKIIANWSGVGITDLTTFINFYSTINTPHYLENLVVSNFSLIGNTLECSLSATANLYFELGVEVVEFYGVGNISNLDVFRVIAFDGNYEIDMPLFMPFSTFLPIPIRIETSIRSVSHLQNFLDFANSMPTVPYRGELFTVWGPGSWDVNIRNAIIAKGWLLPWS